MFEGTGLEVLGLRNGESSAQTIALLCDAVERVWRGFDLKFVSLTMITYWASVAVGALLRKLFYFLAVLGH